MPVGCWGVGLRTALPMSPAASCITPPCGLLMVSTPEELQKQWVTAKLPTSMKVPVEMVMELAMEIVMVM